MRRGKLTILTVAASVLLLAACSDGEEAPSAVPEDAGSETITEIHVIDAVLLPPAA